ncbi:hypothetical protein AWR41_01080 [Riemerella anatipestifer]|nr:hypothetical protein M949_0380 [Riemerella anatipestifer CH3]MSN81523.1 hypothetical protein [Riemerella anatipestifer]MSN87864.1 hypothetical protein [Riemerella anatipestifer]MSN91866.1 hypothetical protein [Riemerella anatipestifer]MSN93759.1 hypothetical protein [Riemerella anatipestifer]
MHKAKSAKELALPTHQDTPKWTDNQKGEQLTRYCQNGGIWGIIEFLVIYVRKILFPKKGISL